MKGVTVALLLIGTVAVTVGGVCFGIGMYNKANNEKVIENKYDITDSFENIDIDLETADLYIKSTDDDKVKVVCNDRKKCYQNVEVVDSTLKIKTVDKRRWFEKWILPFEFKAFDVTVYLPTVNYTNLKIKTATGNVETEKGLNFFDVNIKTNTGNVSYNSNVNYGDLTIDTDTGNVKLREFKASNVTVKTSTGNLYADFVEVDRIFDAKTSTGDQKLNNVNVKDLLSKTTTGNVKLISVIGDNSFTIKTSTGNISFTDCDAKTISGETSTGNIKGNLLTNHIFAASSGTGSVKVPVSTEGGLCELKSSTGNIVITIG